MIVGRMERFVAVLFVVFALQATIRAEPDDEVEEPVTPEASLVENLAILTSKDKAASVKVSLQNFTDYATVKIGEDDKLDQRVLGERIRGLQLSSLPTQKALEDLQAELRRISEEVVTIKKNLVVQMAAKDALDDQITTAQETFQSIGKSVSNLLQDLKSRDSELEKAENSLTTLLPSLAHDQAILIKELLEEIKNYRLYGFNRAAQLKARRKEDRVIAAATLKRLWAQHEVVNTEVAHLQGLLDGALLDIENQQNLYVSVSKNLQIFTHMQGQATSAFGLRHEQRKAEIGALKDVSQLVTTITSQWPLVAEFSSATESWSAGMKPNVPDNRVVVVTQIVIPTKLSPDAYERKIPALQKSFATTLTQFAGVQRGSISVQLIKARPTKEDLTKAVLHATTLIQSEMQWLANPAINPNVSLPAPSVRLTVVITTTFDNEDKVLAYWGPDVIQSAVAVVDPQAGLPYTTYAPVAVRGHVVLNCPNNCSGSHGECLPSGRCKCTSDWTDEDCGRPLCLGGCVHGVCVSPGTCRCSAGFIGRACSVPVECPFPVSTANQNVTCDGVAVGSECSFTCQLGHTPDSDVTSVVCLPNGHWSHARPLCMPVTCHPPVVSTNEIIKCAGFIPGSTCSHTCASGYEPSRKDVPTITCSNSGDWEPKVFPMCQPKSCLPIPEAAANGSVTCSGTTMGSLCHQSCNAGFAPRTAPASRDELRARYSKNISPGTRFVCGADSSWEGMRIECVPTECPLLTRPANGIKRCSGTQFKDTCSFSCEKGYVISHSDAIERVCSPSGTWTGVEAQCVRIDCGPPSANKPIVNGDYICSGTLMDDTCEVACDPRYRLPAGISFTRTCLADGAWSGEESQNIHCEEVTCPAVKQDNGWVDCSGNTPGHVCVAGCLDGWMLAANTNQTHARAYDTDEVVEPKPSVCLPSGLWSPVPVRCVPMLCRALKHDNIGQLNCSASSLVSGTQCQLTCPTGSHIVGHNHVTCQYGDWTSPLGKCVPSTCGNPPLLRSRAPQCTSKANTVGTNCEYTCMPVDLAHVPTIPVDREQLSPVSVAETQSFQLVIRHSADVHVEASVANVSVVTILGSTEHTRGSVEEFAIVLDLTAHEAGITVVNVSLVSASSTTSVNVAIEVVPLSSIALAFHLTCESAGRWIGDIPDECAGELSLDPTTPIHTPDQGTVVCGIDEVDTTKCFVSCRKPDTFDLIGGPSTRIFSKGAFDDSTPNMLYSCVPHVCEPLARPANAIGVSCSGRLVGESCSVVCRPGYQAPPMAESRTCTQVGWSGAALSCARRVQCEPLVLSSNAYPLCNTAAATFAGSVCEVRCQPGFRYASSVPNLAVCGDDGEWSMPSAECEKITCPNPKVPENGNVSIAGTGLGSSASFFCSAGFQLVGPKHRTCLMGGVWSGTAPWCSRRACAPPPVPAYGSISCSNHEATLMGTHCTHTCESGFELRGSPVRTCGVDALWTGSPASCVRIPCEPLTQTAPQLSFQCSGSKYLDSCIGRCDLGFKLVGETTRLCQADGTWSGSSWACTDIRCPRLDSPEAGSILCSGDGVGDTCEVTCRDGFQPTSPKITCSQLGQWSGTFPRCITVECGTPPVPRDGDMKCPSGTSTNSTCTFSCQKGFSLEGSHSRTCRSSATWSGSQAVCSPLDCDVLSPPPHGRLDCTGTTVGHRCTITCDPGFLLSRGRATRQCGIEGVWEGEPATCEPQLCPDLPRTMGLKVECANADSRLPGSSCMMRCDVGFRLVGSPLRECSTSGAWTGVDTWCEPVSCGVPAVSSTGPAPQCGGVNFNSTCVHNCYDNPNNLTTMRCGGGGEWVRESGPSCVFTSCPPPVPPPGVLHKCPEGAWIGGKCKTQCDATHGYVAVSSLLAKHRAKGMMLCMSNSYWKEITPLFCGRPFCSPLNTLEHGYRVCTGHNASTPALPIGGRCVSKCNDGYHFVPFTPAGSNISEPGVLECRAGTGLQGLLGEWVGVDGECVPMHCPMPPQPKYAKMRCTGSSFGDMCYVDCKAWFAVEDVPQAIFSQRRFCDIDGAFSGENTTCVAHSCGEPPSYVSKDLCVVPLAKPISSRPTCPVPCDKGHVGGGQVTCTTAGWTGTVANCVPVSCGHPYADTNAAYVCTSTTYGGECHLTCKNESTHHVRVFGDKPSAVATLTCSNRGSWMGPPASCVAYECPAFGVQEHRRVDCSGFSVGDWCTFSCEEGYASRGSTRMMCSAGGMWWGLEPHCIPADSCSELKEQSGVVTTVCTGNEHGDSCQMECMSGYVPRGDPTRNCINGKWSAMNFSCDSLKCVPPVSPPLSDITCSSLPGFADKCSVRCYDGYQLAPFAFVNRTDHVCLESGKWSNNIAMDKVRCEKSSCPPLRNPYPYAVNVSCSNGPSEIGTKCEVRCRAGYHSVSLMARAIHTCSPGGVWRTHRQLQCVPVKCNAFEGPWMSKWYCSGFEYNATCTFRCPIGFEMFRPEVTSLVETSAETSFTPYIPANSGTSRCNEAGKWTYAGEVCNVKKCKASSEPAHGKLECNGQDVGHQCRHVCDPGFRVSGPSLVTCLPSGLWSSQNHTHCVPVTCPSLAAPANGSLATPYSVEYGSRVTVSCGSGFKLFGSQTRACAGNGHWTGAEPVCEMINCGTPASSAGDSVTCLNGTTYGSTCTHHCLQPMDDTHSYPTTVSRDMICGGNGQWVAMQPLEPCHVSSCVTLPPLAHGSMQCDDVVCRNIMCDAGYFPTTASTSVECVDGAWQGTMPECQPLTCPVIEVPANAKIEVLDRLRIRITCHEGFRLSFNPSSSSYERACVEGSSGPTWSGKDLVGCERLSCGAPLPLVRDLGGSLVVPPGSHIPDVGLPTGTLFGDLVLYRCRYGFTLIGSEFRVCQANGMWSDSAPQCVPSLCSAPPITSTDASAVGYLGPVTPGTSLDWKCKAGHVLYGSQSISCLPSGTWSGDDFACHPVDCGRPSPILNGLIDCTGTQFNDTCVFTCLLGTATGTARCNENGDWEGSIPKCDSVMCAVPLLLPHTFLSCATGFEENSTCEIHCDEGYYLAGPDELITFDNQISCIRGQGLPHWQGSVLEAHCKPRTCPPIVLNPLSITTTNSTHLPEMVCSSNASEHSTLCSFTCPLGTILEGSATSTCQMTGRWSAPVPRCVDMHCPPLLAPAHALVSFTPASSLHRIGATALITCNDGYKPHYEDSFANATAHWQIVRRCDEHLQWSGKGVVCVPLECSVPPPAPLHARIAFADATAVVYACNPGFKLVGEPTLACEVLPRVAVWRGELPVCQPYSCPPLPVVSHATPVCSAGGVDEPANFSSVCYYNCDTGYHLTSRIETTTRECASNLDWTGISPECSPIECQIPVVENGIVQCGNDTLYNSECNITCNLGYRISADAVGSMIVRCTESSFWNVTVTCLAVKCSDPEVPVYGSVKVLGDHSQAVYSCDAGYHINGSDSRICAPTGVWSGPDPVCEAVTCPELVMPTASHNVTCTHGTGYHSRCEYVCEFGKEVAIESSSQAPAVTCSQEGSWGFLPPACQPVECGLPVYQADSHFLVECVGTSLGQQCTYTCEEGSQHVSGDLVRTCTGDRSWSGQPPKCLLVLAPHVTDISEHGTASQSSTQFGLDAQIALHLDSRDCTRTFPEALPWWRIDLGANAQIHSVTLELSKSCAVEILRDVAIVVSSEPTEDVPSDGQGVCGQALSVDASMPTSVSCFSNGGTIGVSGRYVTLSVRRQSAVLALARVRVLGIFDVPQDTKISVAPNGTLNIASPWMLTQMSTQLSEDTSASRALENSKASCSISAKQANPWWQIDLGMVQAIHSVSFDLPPDFTFETFEVRVGSSRLNFGNSNPKCASIRVSNTLVTAVCNNITGQFVNVVIPQSNTTLGICRLSVFATAIPPSPLLNLARLKPFTLTSPNTLETSCLTSTQTDMPKIVIDLQAASSVDHVVIRMGPIQTPLLSLNILDAFNGQTVFCGTPRFASADTVVFAQCPSNVKAIQLSIVANGWNQVLAVCEFEVWGRVGEPWRTFLPAEIKN